MADGERRVRTVPERARSHLQPCIGLNVKCSNEITGSEYSSLTFQSHFLASQNIIYAKRYEERGAQNVSVHTVRDHLSTTETK